MPDDFQSIAEIIKGEPGLKNIRLILSQSEIVREFPKIFPDLARIAEAVKVERKTLFLRVENAVWRNEIKLREKILLDKVNGFFDEIRINKLKFIP